MFVRVRVVLTEPGVTVSVAVPTTTAPLCAVAVAEMVAVQLDGQATAVASPVWSMEATPGSLDCQFTRPAKFWVVGLLLNVPIAMNCAESPIVTNVWVLGSIEMLINPVPVVPVPAATVRVALPVTGPNDEDMVAVIVVVPELRGLANPVELMLATAGLLDTHVTVFVIFSVCGGCGFLV